MMTREEAISYLSQIYATTYSERYRDALRIALSAIRPVSREQVEKVFPGCDFCNMADFGEFGFEITKHYAKICCALGSWRFPQNEQFLFCPKCGKPLTDEAVQMVVERINEMEGTENGLG